MLPPFCPLSVQTVFFPGLVDPAPVVLVPLALTYPVEWCGGRQKCVFFHFSRCLCAVVIGLSRQRRLRLYFGQFIAAHLCRYPLQLGRSLALISTKYVQEPHATYKIQTNKKPSARSQDQRDAGEQGIPAPVRIVLQQVHIHPKQTLQRR